MCRPYLSLFYEHCRLADYERNLGAAGAPDGCHVFLHDLRQCGVHQRRRPHPFCHRLGAGPSGRTGGNGTAGSGWERHLFGALRHLLRPCLLRLRNTGGDPRCFFPTAAKQRHRHCREDAILVVQNNGVSPCLYLLGGQTETEEGLSSCLTDGYVYNPQLGKWSSLGSDFPKGICAAVASGANHILLFQKEPEDTQHLKKENALWKYHTITQTLVKSECIPGTYDTMQVLQRNRSFVILGSNASSGTNRLYSLQGDIVPLEKGLGLVNILVIIGYFAVLAGIGIYFSRRQKSTNDYFKVEDVFRGGLPG